jgi:2-C-methyl-D-erythritol 4-phosphate cytidylyltransferase/2-C-methyl-D-erythritol 2,4-cyclodiphosphate synthase
LSDLTLILLAAGSSSRFKKTVKKQWIRINDRPLWQFVADNMQQKALFSEIIIVASQEEIPFMQHYSSYKFVTGGDTRQASLKSALKYISTKYVLVSDIARACIPDSLLQRLIQNRQLANSVVPYLPVTDTIVYENNTIDRTKVKRIQTPQVSQTNILKKALESEDVYTDESSAIVAIGGTRAFIEGDDDAHKITYISDLKKLPCLLPPSNEIRSGNGFDVHAFDNKSPMWLGGVKIESDLGFKAHSDGDVAIHALIDALLGAAGMGDIGMLFPDNDARYENIDSKKLLEDVVAKLYSFGFEIINADITIAAQKPKIAAYKTQMRSVLAAILAIEPSKMNIKATTTEKLGFIGRAEGVAVIANANLKYLDWRDEN